VTPPDAGPNAAGVRAMFEASVAAKRAFAEASAERVVEAATMIADALEAGGKVLLFGNGGSAADAQHIAAELLGRFERERRALPAIALTTDTSALTAIANDYGYEDVFARQVRGLGKAGDVAIAISTSGSSRSVLRAVDAAAALGLRTVGLTGGSGGELAKHVHVCLCVAATTNTARIQETHITIGHVLCALVEARLGGSA
jgi:D-sedoheptulose 7-phosphate isomerase